MVHLVLDDLGRKACELQSLLLEIHVLAERCVRHCRYRRHPNSLRSQAQRRTERQIRQRYDKTVYTYYVNQVTSLSFTVREGIIREIMIYTTD